MEFSSGEGVVRGRRVQQLTFTLFVGIRNIHIGIHSRASECLGGKNRVTYTPSTRPWALQTSFGATASQSHIINQHGLQATSGLEMCFPSSTFGALGPNGPNQNTSQIQILVIKKIGVKY